MRILVDADGCPVKQEVLRVAGRHGLAAVFVANSWLRLPVRAGVELVVVSGAFDAVDDWIAHHATPADVVITTDIPLAARCLKAGARALGPRGREFTEDDIGDALATRAVLSHLRESGEIHGGPGPFAPRDRSRFLQRLEEIVQALRRRGA